MKLSVEQISRENEEEVIISRHIMLSTFFMCLLFNPASQLPVVSFFGRCILFTLVCMATLVVYYSRTELTLRGWWIRTILHAALLEAVEPYRALRLENETGSLTNHYIYQLRIDQDCGWLFIAVGEPAEIPDFVK